MEWFSLLIPLLVSASLFFWFKHKTTWWEPVLPIVAGVIIILSLKSCAKSSVTTDTEYHNAYVVRVERDERWEEDIECSYDCFCTTDKDGYTSCQTCYYDCPQWHAERYRAVLNAGGSIGLSKSEYLYYKRLFNQPEKFVDLNRRNVYQGHDGDRWTISWPGTNETMEYTVSKHSYENKVQASDDIFNFPEVDTTDVKLYKLKEYPNIYSKNGVYKQKHILGINNPQAERKMEYLNGYLGKKKQLKAFILVWPGGDKMSGNMQEWYWKGGNKNEFIVCLGTDKKNPYKVNWVKVISWSESYQLKIDVREYVNDNKANFKLSPFIDYLHTKLEKEFVRKPFSDFNYLEINIPTGWMIAIYIVVLIFSLGLGAFAIFNQFDADGRNNSHSNWRRRR